MALKVLCEGQRSSLFTASATCFTKANYGNNTNSTLSVNTPRGVLGGSVAGLSAGADYTAYPCHKTLTPIGLFMNDAAGAAFDNASAVASGKITVAKYMSVEVDVYETNQAGSDGDALSPAYIVGQPLYSSAWGLLTNEKGAATYIVGFVTKIPSATSPTIGLNMAI